MSLARFALAAIVVLPLPFAPQTKGTPLIGVAEVPRLLNVYGSAGEPVVPDNVRIPLRARPLADSAVVATITKPEDLATVEYTYEESAAMVHAREGTWSLVKTAGGTAGWMAAEDAGTFHTLEELLGENMAYLTEAWDGTLFAAPGMTDRVLIPDDPDRQLAGYIEPSLEPGVIVPIFERPNELTSITTLQTNRAGEVLQTTHQMPPQVLVFETRPGWYQVARENDGEWRHAQRLWLQASPVWRFRPVADGQPMSTLAERAWGPESRDVRVTATRTIDGRLWAEVELITGHDCGGPGAGVVRVHGWLPAHAASGDLNVWYYPRGC